jgi:putative acetyltransferase
MIEIRRATLRDKQAIYQVHKRAIEEACRTSYSPEQIAAWSDFLRPEAYTEAIRNREFIVARENQAVVGFGQLDVARGHVEAVYVLPEYHRRGIGSGILTHLEKVTRNAGHDTLTLCATLNALPFYKHAGFVEVGPARRDLPDGTSLRCVDMKKNLSERPEAT